MGLGFKDEKAPGQVVSMARERGVLLLTAGTDAVRMVPSLNVNKKQRGRLLCRCTGELFECFAVVAIMECDLQRYDIMNGLGLAILR